MTGSVGGAAVIGAAGGIGGAVAEEFLRRKIHVLGIDLRPSVISDDTQGYEHLELDWRDPASVDVVHDHAVDLRIRYIVNVAGGALHEEVDQQHPGLSFALSAKDETFSINFDTALTTVSLATKLTSSNVTDQEVAVTLCSSVNAIGAYDYPLYSASKGSLEALVHSLSIPLGRQRVRINCVRLGTVVTKTSLSLHGGADSEHYRPLMRLSALGRFVSVQEAASALVTSSVDLTGMTGAIVTVDAGQSIPGTRSCD